MQRYEVEGEKFWEIWIDKTTVFMRFGKIDSNGQTKLKKCADLDSANSEVERFVATKIKEGFTLVSSGKAPTKTKPNTELEKAIIDDPKSPDGYAVYSDWLTEQGDPLGEHIAMGVQLAKKKDKALEKKMLALRTEHKAGWLGPLAEYETDECELVWGFGVLESVALGNEEYSEIDGLTAYRAMRKLPTARFLQSLTLKVFEDDDGQPSYAPIMKEMATGGLPKTLRKLEIDVMGYQVSWTDLGDMAKVWEHLPNLEHLLLHVGKMKLGAIKAPKLKHLEIKTGGLSKDNVKSVASAEWPNLETLILYFGDEEYGCNCTVADAKKFMDGSGIPKVTHLALCNSKFQDDIAKEIVKAKVVKQLKTLDLSKGTMSDEGAQFLLDGAKALGHLTKIDVSENWISEDMQKKLTKAFGKKIDVTSQEESDDSWRYVQVAE